jgi:predicted membrane-bound mannosyltransferase
MVMPYHLAVCVISSLLTILFVLFQHEDKQKAMLEFARVCAAMQTLGFSEAEIKVIWSVLSAIYHLGIAGAVKGIFLVMHSIIIFLTHRVITENANISTLWYILPHEVVELLRS